MDLAEILRSKRQQILQIARKHGAYDVRVFGSVARGEAQPDSDIDLLVAMEPGRSLLDLGGLVMELRQLLGHGVDVVQNGDSRAAFVIVYFQRPLLCEGS